MIAAYPSSINDLDGVQNDVRVVENLVNGVNNTHDGRNMWLAPFSRYTFNQKNIVKDSVN